MLSSYINLEVYFHLLCFDDKGFAELQVIKIHEFVITELLFYEHVFLQNIQRKLKGGEEIVKVDEDDEETTQNVRTYSEYTPSKCK